MKQTVKLKMYVCYLVSTMEMGVSSVHTGLGIRILIQEGFMEMLLLSRFWRG